MSLVSQKVHFLLSSFQNPAGTLPSFKVETTFYSKVGLPLDCDVIMKVGFMLNSISFNFSTQRCVDV